MKPIVFKRAEKNTFHREGDSRTGADPCAEGLANVLAVDLRDVAIFSVELFKEKPTIGDRVTSISVSGPYVRNAINPTRKWMLSVEEREIIAEFLGQPVTWSGCDLQRPFESGVFPSLWVRTTFIQGQL